MINTLEDYIRRSLPDSGDFDTNPNLTKKVDADGSILPYYGNTVVFKLGNEVKNQLSKLQRELYCAAGPMLAEPLEKDSFHMTLHDLVNGSVKDEALIAAMAETGNRAATLLESFKGRQSVRMQATALFNMVNTSLVLGFRPADEESRKALDEMYMAFEELLRLGYAMTPHITMAYFRPGRYSQQQLQSLRSALRKVDMSLELRIEDLELQRFDDMNCYYPV